MAPRPPPGASDTARSRRIPRARNRLPSAPRHPRSASSRTGRAQEAAPARQLVATLGLADFGGFDRGTTGTARVTCLMAYDQQPAMSAATVADAVVQAIADDRYGFILVNFANGDMVGQTAVRDAVIQAVETLDREVGRVLEAAVAADYSVILTTDQGNCEELIDPLTDEPHTQHTVYPVPCLVIDRETWQLSCVGGLANVAPTVLQLMGLPQPAAMTAPSLLLRPLHARIPRDPFRSAA